MHVLGMPRFMRDVIVKEWNVLLTRVTRTYLSDKKVVL